MYFSNKELSCKCGCGTNNVDKKFLDKLIVARELADIPFKLTSVCRCPTHNREEGGKPESSHIATDTIASKAADISTPDSASRCRILQALITVGFNRIGIAKTFIHVDLDTSKPSEVVWVY